MIREVFVEMPFFRRPTSDLQLVARSPVRFVEKIPLEEGWEEYAMFWVGNRMTRRCLLQLMKKKVKWKRS